jgi:hypothetical protein
MFITNYSIFLPFKKRFCENVGTGTHPCYENDEKPVGVDFRCQAMTTVTWWPYPSIMSAASAGLCWR